MLSSRLVQLSAGKGLVQPNNVTPTQCRLVRSFFASSNFVGSAPTKSKHLKQITEKDAATAFQVLVKVLTDFRSVVAVSHLPVPPGALVPDDEAVSDVTTTVADRGPPVSSASSPTADAADDRGDPAVVGTRTAPVAPGKASVDNVRIVGKDSHAR